MNQLIRDAMYYISSRINQTDSSIYRNNLVSFGLIYRN
jgi:predicted transcriptional regulator